MSLDDYWLDYKFRLISRFVKNQITHNTVLELDADNAYALTYKAFTLSKLGKPIAAAEFYQKPQMLRVEESKGFYRDALDIKIEDNDVLLMHWKDLPILERLSGIKYILSYIILQQRHIQFIERYMIR